jgi:hypothetical protein
MPKPVFSGPILPGIVAAGSNPNVYIPNEGAAQITIANPTTGAALGTISLQGGGSARVMLVMPDGVHGYASDSTGHVWPINLTGSFVTGPALNVPATQMIASLDGLSFYCLGSTYITVVSVATFTVTATLPLGSMSIAAWMALTTDGASMYVVGSNTGSTAYIIQVRIKDGVTLQAQQYAALGSNFSSCIYAAGTLYTLSATAGLIAWPPVLPTTAPGPFGLAGLAMVVQPSGALFYVLRSSGTSVDVYYTGSNLLVKTIAVANTNYLGMSEDGLLVFLSSLSAATVLEIATLTNTVNAVTIAASNPGSAVMQTGSNLISTTMIPIVQVGTDQTWNITIATTNPSGGSGSYTVQAGARTLGTANFGQNFGPFTAYASEQITIAGITGNASGWQATIAGLSYNRDEQVPVVNPGISG